MHGKNYCSKVSFGELEMEKLLTYLGTIGS
jgi:hypothetical protein